MITQEQLDEFKQKLLDCFNDDPLPFMYKYGVVSKFVFDVEVMFREYILHPDTETESEGEGENS